MTLKEKASYLKGLLEGLNLDKDDDETKLFANITELLQDMAESVSAVEDGLDDVYDQIDAIDEDLSDVEDIVHKKNHKCGCEDTIYEVKCPNCNETVCINEKLLSERKINCPNCDKLLELDLDNLCECGCECDCDKEDDNCESE